MNDQSTAGRRRRVPPMSPDERRASLVVVTLPLLREFGMAVTTKQIAEAAGIAEGTIFGAFPDKQSLITACVHSAFDPATVVDALRGVDPDDDLRRRLKDAVAILARRFEGNAPLMMVVRTLPPEAAAQLGVRFHEGRQALVRALAKIFEPDRDRLRHDPAVAARVLLSLLFASARDIYGDAVPFSGDQIVDLLLDGLLRPVPTDLRDADPC